MMSPRNYEFIQSATIFENQWQAFYWNLPLYSGYLSKVDTFFGNVRHRKVSLYFYSIVHMLVKFQDEITELEDIYEFSCFTGLRSDDFRVFFEKGHQFHRI